MEQPNYYAIIPAEVRYDERLRDKAKLLYGEIVALSSKTGVCYAQNKYFADLYGVSTTTISTLIKELVDAGHITTEIVYKEGTKEILNRYLKIFKYPPQIILNTPLPANACESSADGTKKSANNTRYNNTSNNNIYNVQNSLDELHNPTEETNELVCYEMQTKEECITFPGKKKEKKKEESDELSKNFNLIWEQYPRKEGKRGAFKHYKSWLSGRDVVGKRVRLTDEQMYDAVCKYADYLKENNIEPQYTKLGSTFFNDAIIDYIDFKERE